MAASLDTRSRPRERPCSTSAAVLFRALAAAVLGPSPALAGHGVGHYPSYYPDEIVIEAMDPTAAARGLVDKTLHAYVGGRAAFDGPVPDHIESKRSLAAFLVLDFNPAATAYRTARQRCAAARNVRAGLGKLSPGAVDHPYPVTPYHADYLHHLDLVAAAAAGDGQPPVPTADAGWRLVTVPVADLVGGAALPDGRPGPPWLKEGWFQAHALLAPAVSEPADRQTIDGLYGRLKRGDYAGLAEQADLERRLVARLTVGCRRPVVGYRLRDEPLNVDFLRGIENTAVDSQRGLNAAVFVRTAKLKDYPWNGRLNLGIAGPPAAAWNPVAGFTDPAGQLLWSALGEPALMPFPFNASWLANRLDFTVTGRQGSSGGVRVPKDALLPEPGTGTLKPVGPKVFASRKVEYAVVASPFLDGTETEVADLLYPYALAYAWGTGAGPRRATGSATGGATGEPGLGAVLAELEPRLAGIRPVRVDQAVKVIAPGLDVVQKTPVIEVYLRDAPGDDHQIAALAPPWSAVPWHLMALMEEAVRRGLAAFSEEEAKRRGVPWLDLVRDEALIAKLLELARELEAKRFRPAALGALVTAEDAARRWRALLAFAEKSGHFLVTNGPYRIDAWTGEGATIKAVREVTYPLGFGTFDRYVHPPRAVIREMARDGRRVTVSADADIVVKVARHYETERQPLSHKTAHGLYGVLVVSRYLLIGPGGGVAAAGKMRWIDDGSFVIDLPPGLAPGAYAVLAAVFLDGNSLNPSAEILRFRAPIR